VKFAHAGLEAIFCDSNDADRLAMINMDLGRVKSQGPVTVNGEPRLKPIIKAIRKIVRSEPSVRL
jgi:hypothetical protein